MITDCCFTYITGIHQHPNAEKLDIGYVNNWQVIIPKGSWTNNEYGIFICPDATLPYAKWVKPFIPYLGKDHRVKIIKLRGEYSNGIFIKLKTFEKDFHIYECTTLSNSELASLLGIGHYQAKTNNNNKNNTNKTDPGIRCYGLPYNLLKTDEENWQSLADKDLHLGEVALITKKLDGCSATYCASPDGNFICCGRKIQYDPSANNNYTIVGYNTIHLPLVKYAKDHNKVIVVRGEITGNGIQNSKYNPDCTGELTFNLYNCYFPEETDYKLRNGFWGQPTHFLEVNKELNFKTVPILGEAVLTKELLLSYTNAPWINGEGVVVNHRNGSFKSKSSDYYSKLK